VSVDYAEVYRLAKKGKRAEQRGKALSGCLTLLATGFLMSLFRGWLFMLAVDVAHNHWVHDLPTIGYWWSVLLVYLLPFAGTSSSKSKSE
jgi:hypothetical protein